MFKEIREGIVPGGVVVYQTYTVNQARLGRPTNPDYQQPFGLQSWCSSPIWHETRRMH